MKYELTSERQAIIDAAFAEALAFGLCTDPADFDTAEAAITRLYARAGRPKPHFVRLGSPFAAQLYLCLYSDARAQLLRQPRPAPSGVDAAITQSWSAIREQLGDHIRSSIPEPRTTLPGDAFNQALRGMGVPLGGRLYRSTQGALWDAMWAHLEVALSRALDDQLKTLVAADVKHTFEADPAHPDLAQRRGQLWLEMKNQLSKELYEHLRTSVAEPLSVRLQEIFATPLGDALWRRLKTDVQATIHDRVCLPVITDLTDQFWARLVNVTDKRLRHMGTWFWGQHDYTWFWLDCGRRVGVTYPEDQAAALDDHLAISRSIGWWYPFFDVCILTDRPDRVSRNAQGALHCPDGPALRYRDTYGLWAIHGVRVPKQVVEAPETLTAEQVRAERNAEVRRVMLDRYGGLRGADAAGKWLEDIGAQPADVDEAHGWLYRAELENDEPLVMLRVACPSTGRVYFLRVPPNMQTAREARAWTFGKDPATFAPEAET